MSYKYIEDVITENFKIITNKKENILEILLMGSFDIEDPFLLIEPFFNNIDNIAYSENIEKVQINTLELFFINSSTIKCIIKWIVKSSRGKERQSYFIDFIINKNLLWQMQSFEYLKFLSNERINIVKI
ncbi:MAG: hypothetical protein JXB50_16780 [Spirochaetes bacterium]|nr:hypothetical protein [Spirochaetota bacterium]